MLAQIELGLDFSPEISYAESRAITACFDRLKQVRRSSFIREKNGTLSRSIALWSPENRRLRRVSEFGLLEIGIPDDPTVPTALMKVGDTSSGLVVVGLQFDKYGLFQEYVPALKLPRSFNSRTRIGTQSRKDWQDHSNELRQAASEIWTSQRVGGSKVDKLFSQNPYVGARI
jgi:hypothetical protein